MTSESDLVKMVRSFRVNDLQELLTFGRRNKLGKKKELLNRALELVKLRDFAINTKINRIHQNRISVKCRNTAPASSGRSAGKSYSSSRTSRNSSLDNEDDEISYVETRPVSRGERSRNPRFPVNPDVKFVHLPFYDIFDVLVPPTSLINIPGQNLNEKRLHFSLSASQAMLFRTTPFVQVQMRLCLYDTSMEQEDEIPASMYVKVNNQLISLPPPIPQSSANPQIEPKRPKVPLDITDKVHRSPTERNDVYLSWATSLGKNYVVTISLVKRINADELVARLTNKGSSSAKTKDLIKNQFAANQDSDIAAMDGLKSSVICPLDKKLMEMPCRATTCSHIACFNAVSYLKANEVKPKWVCPICNQKAYYKDLVIDSLFLSVVKEIQARNSTCKEVEFDESCSWTLIEECKKHDNINDVSDIVVEATISHPIRKKANHIVDVIELDSSDTDIEEKKEQPKKKAREISSRPLSYSPITIDSSSSSSDTICSPSPSPSAFEQFGPSSSKADFSMPNFSYGLSSFINSISNYESTSSNSRFKQNNPHWNCMSAPTSNYSACSSHASHSNASFSPHYTLANTNDIMHSGFHPNRPIYTPNSTLSPPSVWEPTSPIDPTSRDHNTSSSDSSIHVVNSPQNNSVIIDIEKVNSPDSVTEITVSNHGTHSSSTNFPFDILVPEEISNQNFHVGDRELNSPHLNFIIDRVGSNNSPIKELYNVTANVLESVSEALHNRDINSYLSMSASLTRSEENASASSNNLHVSATNSLQSLPENDCQNSLQPNIKPSQNTQHHSEDVTVALLNAINIDNDMHTFPDIPSEQETASVFKDMVMDNVLPKIPPKSQLPPLPKNIGIDEGDILPKIPTRDELAPLPKDLNIDIESNITMGEESTVVPDPELRSHRKRKSSETTASSKKKKKSSKNPSPLSCTLELSSDTHIASDHFFRL